MTMVWRANYCDRKTKYPTCARYKLALKDDVVPATLMPNGTHTGGREPALGT